jgi:cytochrome P450
MVGAANRDPGQFANPDNFEPTRPHNRHEAFGGNAHVCLGSTLARLEGQIALLGLIRRFPRLELLIEQPEWRPGFRLRALRSLLVNLNE